MDDDGWVPDVEKARVYNPDTEGGFFDAVRKVIGANRSIWWGTRWMASFRCFCRLDEGSTWFATDDPGLEAQKGDGAFAASNSSLTTIGRDAVFRYGWHGQSTEFTGPMRSARRRRGCKDMACPLAWQKAVEVPMAEGSAGAGVFSASRPDGRLGARASW